MADTPAFQKITFEKERAKIFNDLQTKSIVLAGLTEDQHQFLFSVRVVKSEVLELEPLAPVGRSIRAGEPVDIMFGLSDGQYLVKTVVSKASPTEVTMPIGNEIFRLQRRNNFRTPIPAHHKISFQLTSFRGRPLPMAVELAVADLSAGGVRVQWRTDVGLTKPDDGDEVGGVITLLSGKQLELKGIMRRQAPDLSGLFIGIELLNLGLRDEQALLFTCMQIQREQLPRVR